MPAARKKTTRKQPQRRAAARAGEASLKRLNKSLDTAHDALTELRKNLGSSGRGAVKDVHQRVTDVRKEARKLNKSVRSELDQLQKSITARTTRAGGRRAATSRKASATKKRSAAKPASTRRKATRAGAKRSGTSARARRAPAKR